MMRVLKPLEEPRDFISCSNLYKAMGGYECDGGRYDVAQRVLGRNGWRYAIWCDAWLAPHTGVAQ